MGRTELSFICPSLGQEGQALTEGLEKGGWALAPCFDLAPCMGPPLENSPRNEGRFCEPALDRTGSNRICLFRKFSQVISPRNEGVRDA